MLKFAILALVVVEAICFVTKTDAVCVVKSVGWQFQPFVAVGSPITPFEAVPPVPMFMVKDAGPLLVVMEGDVPNPDEMVGATEESKRFGIHKDSFRDSFQHFHQPLLVLF